MDHLIRSISNRISPNSLWPSQGMTRFTIQMRLDYDNFWIFLQFLNELWHRQCVVICTNRQHVDIERGIHVDCLELSTTERMSHRIFRRLELRRCIIQMWSRFAYLSIADRYTHIHITHHSFESNQRALWIVFLPERAFDAPKSLKQNIKYQIYIIHCGGQSPLNRVFRCVQCALCSN